MKNVNVARFHREFSDTLEECLYWDYMVTFAIRDKRTRLLDRYSPKADYVRRVCLGLRVAFNALHGQQARMDFENHYEALFSNSIWDKARRQYEADKAMELV